MSTYDDPVDEIAAGLFSRFGINLPAAASKWLDDAIKSAVEEATKVLRKQHAVLERMLSDKDAETVSKPDRTAHASECICDEHRSSCPVHSAAKFKPAHASGEPIKQDSRRWALVAMDFLNSGNVLDAKISLQAWIDSTANASEQDSEAYKHGYQQGVRDCSKHEQTNNPSRSA